jgi:hypothetical protein
MLYKTLVVVRYKAEGALSASELASRERMARAAAAATGEALAGVAGGGWVAIPDFLTVEAVVVPVSTAYMASFFPGKPQEAAAAKAAPMPPKPARKRPAARSKAKKAG